jgi:hypothetical protein
MAHIAKPHLSSKHLKIKSANTIIIISVSVTVFIVMFSLVSARALLSQASYNQKIIGEKKDALDIAKKNRESVKDLEASYRSFATETVNVLGGDPEGTGALDGSNPKIVLDALPSEYDYPALSSSIEKILLENSYQIDRIGGSEDSGNSGGRISSTGIGSSAVGIPYPLSIVSTAEGTKNLLDILERSIRPFYVESLEISGSDASMTAKINTRTFYQPSKSFTVTTKVVD